MSSNSKETPAAEVPLAVAEQLPAAPGSKEAMPKAPEQAASVAEKAPALSPPTLQSIPTIPLPAAPRSAQASQPSDVPTTTQVSVPQVDDDNDLIEKEWVNKAKQIVERNRDNPYKQSEELTVFKADYMKRRYGKTIKVNQ